MERAHEGPGHKLEQSYIKYCPICKGDLYLLPSVKSQDKGEPHRSHSYRCVVCDRSFGINYQDRSRK